MACVEIKQREAKESFLVYSCCDFSSVAEALRDHCTVYFYNYGVYGWNCHLFPITKGIALSIGYRPFGKTDKNINKLIENLNNSISGIDKASLWNYVDYRKEVDRFVNEFIERVEKYVVEGVCND